jgi:hypothetical protein
MLLPAGHVSSTLGALLFKTGYPAFMGGLVTAVRTDTLTAGAESLSATHASSPPGAVLTPAPTGAALSSSATLASWYHGYPP